jgi:hypothetical protein
MDLSAQQINQADQHRKLAKVSLDMNSSVSEIQEADTLDQTWTGIYGDFSNRLSCTSPRVATTSRENLCASVTGEARTSRR